MRFGANGSLFLVNGTAPRAGKHLARKMRDGCESFGNNVLRQKKCLPWRIDHIRLGGELDFGLRSRVVSGWRPARPPTANPRMGINAINRYYWIGAIRKSNIV